MNTCAVRHATMDSPIGTLGLELTDRGLARVLFEHELNEGGMRGEADPVALAPWTERLRAYFEGERPDFDLPLDVVGTPFQRRVWQGLSGIPYGATWTYAELAAFIGRPSAARAVGAANGKNPLPVVVPCHRVLGAKGKLTGYSGGLDIKRRLLALEAGPLRLVA